MKLPKLLLLIYLIYPLTGISQSKGVIPFNVTIHDTILTEESAPYYIMQLDSLIALDSTNAYNYDYRAILHFKLHNMKDAYRDYSKAIFLKTDEPKFYLNRGLLLYSLKMPDEAINDYTKALLLAQNKDTLMVEILVARGNAKSIKRDYQGAYEDYLQGVTLNPNNVPSMSGLGTVLDDLGREDEAVIYLEKALRLSPNDIIVMINLGYRCIMKGTYSKAIEWYDKVLRIDSLSSLALNNRGFAKYKLNKLKEALEDVNSSLIYFPHNAFAYKNRALIYIALKQENKACEDIGQALQFGFTQMYGDEVEKLKQKHCIKQL